jgi:hypothetical protein
MNARNILASTSFLVLGAFVTLPALASVEPAGAALGLAAPIALTAPQHVADDSIDRKDNGRDDFRDDSKGDLGLSAPSAYAPKQLADNSGDGPGDGSSSDGHGDGKGSSDGHGEGKGKGSSDGHGEGKGSSEGHGKGSSDGHGDSGHSSGHSSAHGSRG